MKPLKRTLLTLSLAAGLAALARADLVERVIVRVNGDIVTQSEFEARQVAAVQQARIGAGEVERYLRETNARILQEAIDELLLVQRAGELGYKVPAAYLNEVIEGIKKENNIASDDDLRDQLRREGMSLDDLRRNIERSVLRRQVLQRELESKMTVPEPEARAEYDAHLSEYTREPSVTLQEIFLKGEGPEAREKAEALAARARAGEDFATLARESSQGATAQHGGDLGTLARGDLSPELQKVAFALAPGAVSDPLAQGGGYRLLKVVEKKDGSVVPFAEAKDEIVRRLSQKRMTSAYDEYVAGLRKTALIDLKVREVPLSVDMPVGPGLEAPSLGKVPGGVDAVSPSAPPAAAAPSAPAAASPAAEDIEEFTTSPQARPERVTPPALPGQPAPAPTP
ncbi:MAG TPA: peptidyl-prolyl cis-trans isomerase, partial [Vicinamibacteria bacterium]|nr:peptidyl-prolyl cis-trans isomerase [Vicinamibacteria bacterium]